MGKLTTRIEVSQWSRKNIFQGQFGPEMGLLVKNGCNTRKLNMVEFGLRLKISFIKNFRMEH